ncbi:hypothetical protein NYR55_11415 [Sphingomonas sp. BGYR3]|uniref:hypothetical protein n=1 Tax=Sphingomonas sp. BGYR3 TaxID=2975483 RepID=UPI0021A58636|nr:hypothetical protein [Sphingomonas sp. BGYR3]MDG5489222.1 hypothetical protein [Sphingomonas sp. BGYR3]
MKLMYMDERLAHPKDAPASKTTALTAVLIDPSNHLTFRNKFYGSLYRILEIPDNTMQMAPEIHAMNLFQEGSDQQRIDFSKWSQTF